ncbi:uncharacterized protein LOC110870509 [Helianthus annuus]|uniref:uncharacterized protein LOC110870509 n=1 Tax=Helianthus annuus TaxID=4232 RepID=UPI000B9095C1|nr:uncharacterized protein LOC110870509 [Helianthus annuus]
MFEVSTSGIHALYTVLTQHVEQEAGEKHDNIGVEKNSMYEVEEAMAKKLKFSYKELEKSYKKIKTLLNQSKNAKEGTNEREDKDNDVVESGNNENAMVDEPIIGEGENEGEVEGGGDQNDKTTTEAACGGGNSYEATLEAKARHVGEGGGESANGVEDFDENDIKSWDCDYKRSEYEIVRYNGERTVFRNVTEILGLQRQDLEQMVELKRDIDYTKMVAEIVKALKKHLEPAADIPKERVNEEDDEDNEDEDDDKEKDNKKEKNVGLDEKRVSKPARHIQKASIMRQKMDRRTMSNKVDCGIFTMRHMETYVGQMSGWKYGLAKEDAPNNL